MHAFHSSIPASAEGCAQCAPLDDFLVFSAAGADALTFLHGQLTQDVTGLPADAARLAGYCTAKGRLLATLVMWRAPASDADDAPRLYGLVRQDLAQALIKRLSMFVLRAKARLAATPLRVAGVLATEEQAARLEAAAGALPRAPWQRADLPSGTWIAAPSADARLRWWWIASDEQLAQASALAGALQRIPAAQWHAADLAAGIPWITAATQDVFIPQTVNLDLIQGVSFTKGCYPGQEVVARSHYRGTVKRRMAYGTIAGAEAQGAALAGVDVYDAAQPGEPTGRIVDAASEDGVVSVLFETALAALPDGDLRLGAADGPRIAAAPLPYSIAP
ncbi:tRNA-modifying protein ygfZ [Achromobacter denitrificans]|jgi:folate-binding protein YgfZ|uniref:Folate-binding protein YgfZ n=1 Tax=Achromobacter denitrificans TaxID=32002 RepID=A0A6J5CCK0_ACHDE|nr:MULTISPECIES: folate-binding protein YgfZ [Achromobacter]MBV2157173.1 folate-binding protein YgfZ [Achromobacter denitrificans]OLU06499.1 folate-binding protein YgfZ [Achromobacter denitrificans]QKH40877.1 folate-binding protein YgfZ [Achromobacter denitrificans]QKH51977.1 folate-binding protein YgfZ [Achromobacter denitrificans]QKQ47872.1 folate-binding protein YgfZ [Achromobacter denitrificans]